MALTIKKGVIKMLGNATTRNGNVLYSLIEMDDGTLLNDLWTNAALDNFLDRALKSNNDSTFFLQGKRIRALTVDGKTYVFAKDYVPPVMSIIFLLIGIPLCFFIVGYFVVFANIKGILNSSAINEVMQTVPDAIKL